MLKKGDKVVMHTCLESEKYEGKVWTCKSDEFVSDSGAKAVFLENYLGYFATEFLVRVEQKAVEMIKGLYEEVKKMNASNGHAEFNEVFGDLKAIAVVSVYYGQKPAHVVLDELIEWAEQNGKVDVLDKSREFMNQ